MRFETLDVKILIMCELTLKRHKTKWRPMKLEILNLELMHKKAVEISVCTPKLCLRAMLGVWIGILPIHMCRLEHVAL